MSCDIFEEVFDVNRFVVDFRERNRVFTEKRLIEGKGEEMDE